ncbi:LpqN/LpqT family lipoprotein [Mycolicibacterium porcinum]|uniref:LpqN/LpqT family lipoprotein n=1 Tax=Mycolicibacterium porcinum TaxID=39693 RepID=UPI0009F6978D|nr:LpqN/LpqT family lipoprotein [Mycolicibacterium porcinum]
MGKFGQLALFVSVIGLSTVGCSSPSASDEDPVAVSQQTPEVSAVPASDDEPGACAESAAPLLKLKSQAPREPELALPQPDGWVRSTKLDSELIRGIIINDALRANDFSPNAGVTLEDLTGKVETPQQAFDAELNGVTQVGGTIESQTPSTRCGQPAVVADYRIQGRPATALIVVAKNNDKLYAATLTVQTAQPDNPTYVKDKKTILDGFQLELPKQ